LLGHTGDISRFATEDKFAAYNGTAPIEWSSGNPKRPTHRLSRRGNRTMNHALHIAAVTQLRHAHSPGRAFYDRKRQEGHTSKSAIRALKRRISNTVYRHLTADARRVTTGPQDGSGRATRERLSNSSVAGTIPEHRHFGESHSRTRPQRYAEPAVPSTDEFDAHTNVPTTPLTNKEESVWHASKKSSPARCPVAGRFAAAGGRPQGV
jgi:hypothetical protein